MHRNDMANEELEGSDKTCTLRVNGHKHEVYRNVIQAISKDLAAGGWYLLFAPISIVIVSNKNNLHKS